MVINRFSEARGVFEPDEFLVEPCIYCFGDDGGDSDGGGGRGSSMDSLSDDPDGDFGVDTGSGQRGGGDNDNDKDSGFDMSAAVGSYLDRAIADFGIGPTTGVMQGDPMSEAIAAGTADRGFSAFGGGDNGGGSGAIGGIEPAGMSMDDVYNIFGGPEPSGAAAPVDFSQFSAFGGPRTAVLGSTEVVPGFAESVDRAISDFMGEYYGGITEQLPDGTISKELFTDLGDFVSQPTEFFSGYTPVQQQRMQEGYKADYGLKIPNVEVFGQKIPLSVVGAAVNAIAYPENALTQALRQGATPVYGTLPGQQGNILGATSPSGDIVYSNSPFGDTLEGIKGTFGMGPGIDPAMAEVYARQQELADAEAAARDKDSGEAAVPEVTAVDPVTQTCPPGYVFDPVQGACVYQGRAMARNPFSAVRGPRNFQYTGIGSLQPFRLQPTPTRQPTAVDPFALVRS